MKTGSVVIPIISASHQCKGASCCIFSPSDFCGEQERIICSPEDRQYDGSVLYQSDGWNSFQEINGDHIPDLELELRKEDILDS